jgi:hypothetical protein
MKKSLFIILLFPFIATAQKTQPRFENDTVYTTSGYKIYKGQILHLANGTADAGYFRFVKFHPSMVRNDSYSLQNSTILVNKLKGYKNSGFDDYNIRIFGTVTYKDGRQAEIDIVLNFEKAMESFGSQPAELTVPEEFKNKHVENVVTAPVVTKKQDAPTGDIKKLLIADEIKKLFDLYKQGALTKDEYEAQKKKLLDRQ